MTRRNVFLADPQYAALEKLATKTGLTVAELIRRAIDDYLTSQKQPRLP